MRSELFLGISHGTLQTLRDTGKLPFSRIGGVIYYSREELEQLLDKKSFANLIMEQNAYAKYAFEKGLGSIRPAC